MKAVGNDEVRIAIPASGGGKDRPADARFGRCSHFAIYDTASKAWSFVENPARHHEHGAGIAAARCLIDQRVDVVIGPRLGPNAARVLEEAAIRCFPLPGEASSGVSGVLERWLKEREPVR